jgi:hypothetical protein
MNILEVEEDHFKNVHEKTGLGGSGSLVAEFVEGAVLAVWVAGFAGAAAVGD